MAKQHRRSHIELFRARVDRIEARLRALSFDELNAVTDVPELYSLYSSHILGWQIVPIIEQLDPNTIQVVVQGFLRCPWPIPGSHVHVAGFQRSRSGNLLQLQPEQLYPYD